MEPFPGRGGKGGISSMSYRKATTWSTPPCLDPWLLRVVAQRGPSRGPGQSRIWSGQTRPWQLRRARQAVSPAMRGLTSERARACSGMPCPCFGKDVDNGKRYSLKAWSPSPSATPRRRSGRSGARETRRLCQRRAPGEESNSNLIIVLHFPVKYLQARS